MTRSASGNPAAFEPAQVPAARAVADRLLSALAVIEKRAPLVLEDRDPEDLHKLRVAVRQSRALLKAVGTCLPPKSAKRGKKGLRWLGRVTTPVRDLDVLLAGDAQAFSEGLQVELGRQRAREWEALAAALRSERFARFCDRWRTSLRQVESDGPAYRPVADSALLAAATRFVDDARALSPDSRPEALHALRKDGKQLRYLLEFFGDLYSSKTVKALLKPLKRAQDALGHYQDLTAHSSLLTQFDEAQPFLEALAAQEPVRRALAMEALAPFREAGALDTYREMTAATATTTQRTLVLWRHAKSDWDDAALADIERPLARRGHEAAPEMAGWLAEQWPPDRVICSPARRTVATWQYLAPLLPDSLPVRFDARAYLAEAGQLRALIAEAPAETEVLLVIGHNPGLEDLVAELAGSVGKKFPTAAVAVLQFEGGWNQLQAGEARLVTFFRPKRK